MKMKRILATALAVMMAMSLAACGQKSEQSANSGSDTKSTTIHLWANGSDNVRQVFEALSADFNGNAEANQGYQVELNFLLSGTGGQSMPDMLAAACKSNQTNTEYDLVDMGGDDLSKVVLWSAQTASLSWINPRSPILPGSKLNLLTPPSSASLIAAPPWFWPTTLRM